jgi:hypothetical protein
LLAVLRTFGVDVVVILFAVESPQVLEVVLVIVIVLKAVEIFEVLVF